ncbi:MAG: DUF4296 domain-containing protein [Paramuribaculum sp.]|nr:DUF4296 domain-containing protein [Paramuribaculum sp.]
MKTVKLHKVFSAAVSLAMLCACSGRPSEVLSKEEMAQLLADIHTGESVVESLSRTFPDDSTRRAFLQAIYEKHGVSRQQVDSSFSWYGYHLEKYMEVYDRTVEILEARLEKAQEIAGATAEGVAELSVNLQGDSVDVWPGFRWRRFSANMPNDHITFNILTDNNWERGDVYTLRTKFLDNHGPVSFAIAAEYNDGRREYIAATQPGDGWHEIRFALDSARSAQRIYGVIAYTTSPGETVFIDSISLYRTRWGGHYRDLRQTVRTFQNRTVRKSNDSRRVSVDQQAAKQPVAPLPLQPGRQLRVESVTPLQSEGEAVTPVNPQLKHRRLPRPEKK